MFEQLTQQQQWGFAYAAKLRNELPGAQKTNWTAQEIAAERLAECGDSLYADLENFKWGLARQLYNSATPEQQAALLQQFGIPDVL